MSGKLENIIEGIAEDSGVSVIERHGAIAELHSAVVDIEAVSDKYEDNPKEQASAVLEAMIMFGVTVTKMPDSDKWLKELQFYAKRRPGDIDLSQYDLDDEIELEYVFKRHRLLTPRDLVQIGMLTGWQDQDNMTLEQISELL